MKTVWTLMTGEKGHGGSLKGIFSRRSEALDAALRRIKSDEEWYDEAPRITHETLEEIYWTDGCDWIQVKMVLVDAKVV